MKVKNHENMFWSVNCRVVTTSSRHDWNIRKSKAIQKIKYTEYIHVVNWRCMNIKLVQVFQRNYNAVLWRQTRRPMQMLARARHSSPLNISQYTHLLVAVLFFLIYKVTWQFFCVFYIWFIQVDTNYQELALV